MTSRRCSHPNPIGHPYRQNPSPDQNEESHLLGGFCNLLIPVKFMAPEVGLEPTTCRLTAECSAIELLRTMLAQTHVLLSFSKKP